jgi:hypothetical protein
VVVPSVSAEAWVPQMHSALVWGVLTKFHPSFKN